MTDLSVIKSCNKELNGFSYGVPGCDHKEDYLMKCYKYLSPQKFYREKKGVCWDYVRYEDDWFQKNKPNIKKECVFVMHDNHVNMPTHTFLIFKMKNNCYWFESSWKSHVGVHVFPDDEMLIKRVIELTRRDAFGHVFSSYMCKYNPADIPAGTHSREFMDIMLEKVEKI